MPRAVVYHYDLTGKLIRLDYPSGQSLQYDYTDGSIFKSITGFGSIKLLEYDLNNDFRIPLKATYFQNGVSAKIEVDYAYQSKHLNLLKSKGLKIGGVDKGLLCYFEYNALGLK